MTDAKSHPAAPAIVLFGLDGQGRPLAATFAADQTALESRIIFRAQESERRGGRRRSPLRQHRFALRPYDHRDNG
jgi:hypothetical protein